MNTFPIKTEVRERWTWKTSELVSKIMMIDIWTVIGFIAQGMFFGRFFIQWIVSERRGESTVPLAFWIFSVLGGSMLLMYAIHRKDAVFIFGQAGGLGIYARNLMLIYKKKQR